MHVVINVAGLHGHEVAISDGAADLVRMAFNPSSSAKVREIKALAAALLSAIDGLPGADAAAMREASIARTHVQAASMFAVAAATRPAG